MFNEYKEAKNARVLTSKGYSVRVAEHNGSTMYCGSDLFTVCGYRNPSGTCSEFVRKPWYGGHKMMLKYPVKTTRGTKNYDMIFLDLEAAREVLSTSSCGDEAKKWLEECVFIIDEKIKQITPEVQKPETVSLDDLNKCIDRMLIEILEIKKYIAAVVK